jgi:hypothetical protein
MATKPRSESAVNALRMIPTKWAVILLGILIVYVVLQPRLNQWFGWQLPTVASMVGDEKPAKATNKKSESTKNDSSKNDTAKLSKKGKEVEADLEKEHKHETASSKKKPAGNTKIADDADQADEEPEQPINTSGKSDNNNPSQPAKAATKPKNNSDDSEPLYGFLTEVGRNRYESPAGLIYGPGSEEGHRLKHIARHLEDQPDRPGSHGVFKGDMKAFLTAIDEGYVRAKKGAKGTTKNEDDGSMVYEITFDKAIGFIGGEAGGRKKNQATKKLRLVVKGNNVITAFPF